MKGIKQFCSIVSVSYARLLCVAMLSFVLCAAEGEETVAFCGIVSRDAEGSMVKMTEDLYYTQLCSIDGIKVLDMRKSGFAAAYLAGGEGGKAGDLYSDSRLSAALAGRTELSGVSVFYALIAKENDDKWMCSLCLSEPGGKSVRKASKAYDSYYKILMENKGALLSSFRTLLNGGGEEIGGKGQGAEGSSGGGEAESAPSTRPSYTESTDTIAGTWTGEDGVDKAVILRGGRGFIIFSNGATMNIKVETLEGGERIVITQAGKSNASFFPELPREVALNMAAAAEPIVWTLSLDDDGTLTGEKRTLVSSGKGAKAGNVSVTWRRK